MKARRGGDSDSKTRSLPPSPHLPNQLREATKKLLFFPTRPSLASLLPVFTEQLLAWIYSANSRSTKTLLTAPRENLPSVPQPPKNLVGLSLSGLTSLRGILRTLDPELARHRRHESPSNENWYLPSANGGFGCEGSKRASLMIPALPRLPHGSFPSLPATLRSPSFRPIPVPRYRQSHCDFDSVPQHEHDIIPRCRFQL